MADQEEYAKVFAVIGGHKRYLSRLGNNTAPYVEAEKLEGEQLIEAKELVVSLESRLSILQVHFDGILGNPLLTDANIEEFELYMSGIKKKLAKLKNAIEKSSKIPVEAPDEKKPMAEVKKPADILESAVRYPELKLPQFSGGETGIRDFRPFYQLFKALVEDKEGISDVYKVGYLRACLPEGSEAWNLISYIPATAENYKLHVETLYRRYNDDVGEVNRLRRELKQVSTWQMCNSVESQRRLVDHVHQNLSLLQQWETVEVAEMKSLALDIISVLPERLKFKVAKLNKEDRDPYAILELVEESISRKLEVNSFSDPRASDSSRRHQSASRQSTQSRSYHTKQSNRASGSSQPCVYCGDGGHQPHTCTKKPKEDRAAIVLKARRCWNCLSDQHQVRSCTLPSRCQCDHNRQKDKHSQSLCGVVPPWRSRGPRPSGAYVIGEPVATRPPTGTGLSSTGAPYRFDIGPTFLSSVEVDLPGKDGGLLKVRLLLDQCATHTYGRESKIDRLQVVDGPAVDITVSA